MCCTDRYIFNRVKSDLVRLQFPAGANFKDKMIRAAKELHDAKRGTAVTVNQYFEELKRNDTGTKKRQQRAIAAGSAGRAQKRRRLAPGGSAGRTTVLASASSAPAAGAADATPAASGLV